MFSILSKTANDIVNSVICTAHFPENFNSVFNKEIEKRNFWRCSIACKKGRTDLIIRIFSFNNKN